MGTAAGGESDLKTIARKMAGSCKKTKFIVGRALTFTIVALLSSCASTDGDREQSWVSFRCPDGRTVKARFDRRDEFAGVQFAGQEWRLPHAISGSGARYSDGKTTFWNKGNSTLLEVDDKIIAQDCVLQG